MFRDSNTSELQGSGHSANFLSQQMIQKIDINNKNDFTACIKGGYRFGF